MNPKGSYKVVRYHEYGIAKLNYAEVYFRWYWQANLYSFLLHHLLGYCCWTFKKNLE